MDKRDFRLPDGTFIRIPLRMSFQEADQMARAKYPDAYQGQQSQNPPREGFFANVAEGTRALVDSTGVGARGIFDAESAKAAAQRSIEAGQGTKSVAWQDVKDAYAQQGLGAAASEFGGFARDTIGQAIPQIGATVLGAKAGALAGGVAGPIGAGIGAVVGGVGANVLPAFGGNIERQVQESPDAPIDRSKAAVAATGMAALDALPVLGLLGKLGVGKVAGEALQNLAKKSPEEIEAKLVASAQQSLLAASGKGAALGVVVEMPTEVAQTVLERWQAGLGLTGADAYAEYEAAAAGGGVVGAPLGAAGRVYERSDAQGTLDTRARTAEAAERQQAAQEEQRKKEEEKARRESPQGLLELDAQYQAVQDELTQLRAAEKAIVKPAVGSAEAVEKAQLRAAIREKIKEAEPLAKEWSAAKGKITQVKEQQRKDAMSPEDYYLETLGVQPSKPQASSIEEMALEPRTEVPAESAVFRYAQDAAEVALAPYGGVAVKDTEAEVAELLMRDPAQAKAFVDAKIALPQFSAAQNRNIRDGVQMRLREVERAEKAALKAELNQRQQDLKTAPTEEKDPLALLRQSLEDDAKVREEGESDLSYLDELFESALRPGQTESTVAIPEGVAPTDNAARLLKRLDDLEATRDEAGKRADSSFRSGNREAGAKAAAEREAAAVALNRFSEESPLVGAVIAGRKEQEGVLADTAELIDDVRQGNTLAETGRARAERDAYLKEMEESGQQPDPDLLQRLEAAIPAGATNTMMGLKAKLDANRKRFINAVLREAAATRAGFGKALGQSESFAAIKEINTVFNEWVDRALALPKRDVAEKTYDYDRRVEDAEFLKKQREDFVAEALRKALTDKIARQRIASIEAGNPQQRGAETTLSVEEKIQARNAAEREFTTQVKGALPRAPQYQLRGEKVVRSEPGRNPRYEDPRPPAERSLGAYREATEVLQEKIRQIGNRLGQVPDTARRESPLLRTQFAQSEAQKVAEQRGETAATRGGELRRRREYVGNLVDKALGTRGVPFRVQQALQRAKDSIDTGTTDVVSEQPTQGFTAGMLDAAEELATRAIEGRAKPVREQEIKLIRQIEGARAERGDAEGQEDLFVRTSEDQQPGERTWEGKEKIGERKWAQEGLFSPSQLDGEEASLREQVAAKDAEIAAAKGAKTRGMREGAERVQRVNALQEERNALTKRLAQIERDKKGLKKEGDRLQGELGFFRATAANFQKAPAVMRGREIAARAKQQLASIKQALEGYEARKKASEENKVAKKKKQVLNLQENVERQRQDLLTEYAAAVQRTKDAIVTKRRAEVIPALKKEVEAAKASLEEMRSRLNDATVDPRDEDATYVTQLEEKYEAELAKLRSAEEALSTASENISNVVEAEEFQPLALADELVVFERKTLEKLERELEKLVGPARDAKQAEVDRQGAALARAEQLVKDAAVLRAQDFQKKLTAIQTGLGLPGVRRVGGRTAPIRTPSEIAAEQREEARVRRENEASEIAENRETREMQKKVLQDEIAEFNAVIERKTADKKRLRSEKSIAAADAQIENARRQIVLNEARIKAIDEGRPVRVPYRASRDQSAAPFSMRTGTPESREVTDNKTAALTGKAVAARRKSLRDAVQGVESERRGRYDDVESIADLVPRGDVFFSRGGTNTGNTIKAVVSELDTALGEAGLVRGRVQVFESPEALMDEDSTFKGRIPSDARGMVANGKAYLFANNIPKGNALAILLHEVGAHVGFRNLLSKAEYEQLVSAIKAWATRPADTIENKIFRKALNRVEAANTPAKQRDDELIAYAVEEAVNAEVAPTGSGKGPLSAWLRRIIDALKKALEQFGISPDKLTAQQLVDMAYGAAQLELKGTYHGSPYKFSKFDHSHMGKGEGHQAYGWGTYRAQRAGVASTYLFPQKAAEKWLASPAAKKHFEKVNNALLNAEPFFMEYSLSEFLAQAKDKKMSFSDRVNIGVAAGVLDHSFFSSSEAILEYQGRSFPSIFRAFAEEARAGFFDASYLLEKGFVTQKEIDTSPDFFYFDADVGQYLVDPKNIYVFDESNLSSKEIVARTPFIQKDGKEVNLANLTAIPEESKSSLYRTLHASPDSSRLHWHSTVEDQPEGINAVFEQAFNTLTPKQKRAFVWNLNKNAAVDTGQDMYLALGEALYKKPAYKKANKPADLEYNKQLGKAAKRESHKAASELLNKFGITGIKFKDGTSRAKSKKNPTYNYVDFSDKEAEIVFRNLNPIGPAKEPLFSRGASAQYASKEVGEAAGTMIGRDRGTVAKVREAATGLGFRTRFIDNYAGLKEALKRGDAGFAIQVGYDLMNFAQRNHFVQQTVMNGAPTREWWGKEGNKDVYKTEVKDGPSLRKVSELLNEVKGYGNAQGVSDAFTLLAVGKRAQSKGWDRTFGDLLPIDAPSKESKEQKANREKRNAEIEEENKRRAAARATATKLASELDSGNSPFAAAYAEYQGYNKNMLRFAMQAGIISEQDFRDLSRDENYTPLFRADKNGNLVLQLDAGRDITVGKIGDEAHLREMLGGSGQVMDFFTASVRNASILIDASLHNIASREAGFALEAMGAAKKVGDTVKNPNVIEFRVKGEKDIQRFEIDTDAFGIPTDLVVKGFAGVPASLPGWVRLMGMPATLLRKTVTRNPLYMFRQLIRDPMNAWLVTGANMAPISGTLSELGKSLTGKADTTLDRRGITGGMMFSEDIADIERVQEAARKAPPWSVGYWMAKLDDMALAADAITRRNVYNGSIKEGASEIQATISAYESMPFSKRGTSPSMRYLNHMVPFLSATVQGMNVIVQAARGDMPLQDKVNIRNKLLQRGAMIAGLTALYAMSMEENEEYKNANTSERMNSWFVPVPGTGQTIKLPVPFELGIIFKMIPEAMVRVMYSDKEIGSEVRAVGEALGNMVPNVMIPQAMLPMVETMLNKSFFTGNPIEGRGLEGVDIGERFDYRTSELSKLLGFDVEVFGKQIGISPKMLEYMMGQYTAGLYPALAALVDTILPAPAAAKPDRTLAELPLFRSALVQEDAGGEVNRLYEKMDKFSRYNATFKKMLESEPERASKYAQENALNLAKGEMANKMRATINKLNEVQNTILANPRMTSAEKKAALDRIKKTKTSLSASFSAALT